MESAAKPPGAPRLSDRSRGGLLLAATVAVPWLVALPGGRWLLPLVAPLTLYGWFSRRVRLGDYFGAWKLGMAWAALLSLGVIWLAAAWPAGAEAGILHGPAYRAEMFQWVETGVGRENEPAAFIPQHLVHLGLFIALAWASGGYLGLVLGAALVAYMSYFVGGYAVESGRLVAGSLAAWVPWSVLRVAAFVLLGSLFARPLLVRDPWPFGRREAILAGLAATGIAGDILLKSLLAPTYGLFLRQLAGGAL